jgi:outer membrane receptor protein involved in Fe transport
VCVSYGLRAGNDYSTGGHHSFEIPSSYQKWDGLMSLGVDLDRVSRIEFDYLRTEMNDVELPGVIYDIDSSKNDQFNVRYIVQEDRQGPQQLLVQTWYAQTPYHGDASRQSKQESLYRAFFTEAALGYVPYPVNTVGKGYLDSLGIRLLRTFGDADSPQWTVGTDWRRYQQRYDERNLASDGAIAFDGNVYGIPRSKMDDVGALTDLMLPFGDEVTFNIGGRVDQCMPSMDSDDPVVTEFDDPEDSYYMPGFLETSRTLGMAYITAKRKLTEATTFRAGTAFAMRSPDLTELYNDEPYVPFMRFGNSYIDGLSNLRPERNLQVDLGLTHETKRVAYGARAFYANIHDYILPAPTYIDASPPYPPIDAPRVLGRDFRYFPFDQRYDVGTHNENADTNQAGYQYVNIDEAVLLGGDLSGELRIRDGLAVFGSMSYVYGVNHSPVQFLAPETGSSLEGTTVPLGGSDGLPGIYPFNGIVGVRVSEPTEDRWCVEFLTRMVHHQDHVAKTLSEIPNPGFTTFALRGYYRVRKNVRVSLDLENLLNRYYSEPDSLAVIGPSGSPVFIPEPGFSALLGIEARF